MQLCPFQSNVSHVSSRPLIRFVELTPDQCQPFTLDISQNVDFVHCSQQAPKYCSSTLLSQYPLPFTLTCNLPTILLQLHYYQHVRLRQLSWSFRNCAPGSIHRKFYPIMRYFRERFMRAGQSSMSALLCANLANEHSALCAIARRVE